MSLKEKVVFITGGATGIGAAMVDAFLSQGAIVCTVDHNHSALSALDERYRASAKLWSRQIDVTEKSQLEKAIADIHSQFSHIDVLINNVANDTRTSIEKMDMQDWEACMQINLNVAFHASKLVSAGMKARQAGNIINFGSLAASIAQPEMTGYITAKAGILGMTRAMAVELGSHNIRVNAIMPGWIATERQLDKYLSPEKEREWMQTMCLKQRIYPADVAKLALFLASDDSSKITGQTISINGGKQ